MKNKKQMAAIAAVMAYVGMEGIPAETPMVSETPKAPRAAASAAAMNLWGISGRQAQMQMRALMQTKSLHGAKLR